MKLNQREKMAILAMEEIINAVKKGGEALQITHAQYTAIKDVLGIDLKRTTFPKKNVDKFVRGKSDFYIIFNKPFANHAAENRVRRHGYFPFQTKNKPAHGAYCRMSDSQIKALKRAIKDSNSHFDKMELKEFLKLNNL